VLRGSSFVVVPDGQRHWIDDDHEMISLGWANQTPWNCPRDLPEDDLVARIGEMTAQVQNMPRAVFNFHVPPHASQLDNAPQLDERLRTKASADGVAMTAVGSTAVRAAIERHQPLLGLHGHVHESKGSVKIGRTLCLNPGSEYGEGLLRGALIDLGRDKVKSFLLTAG
jgi:Icc-related predicted phosphoesterase